MRYINNDDLGLMQFEPCFVDAGGADLPRTDSTRTGDGSDQVRPWMETERHVCSRQSMVPRVDITLDSLPHPRRRVRIQNECKDGLNAAASRNLRQYTGALVETGGVVVIISASRAYNWRSYGFESS